MQRVGTWAYASGANGSISLPKGARILQLVARSAAGGSVSIFGGSAIPLIAGAPPLVLRFDHDLATNPLSQALVFTTTDSYFVEYLKAGNT